MTERGLPAAGGASACPFVAFEDDRDERGLSPDHRHRCYAEAEPAPRALAHQEAYCLSSAFPVCPTFQDWARREAAHSRADGPRHSEATAAEIAAAASQRNPPRNWAAPPPWAGRGGGPAPSWSEGDADELDELDEQDEVPRRGRGLSGSYADRVAADAGAAMPGGLPLDDEPEPGDEPAADRWTSQDEEGAGSDAATGAAATGAAMGANRHRERDPARVAAFSGEGEVQHPPPAAGPHAPLRERQRRRDPGAPEWESARPLEAYPTLRSKRLPELSIPPLLVGVIALALAAAVLFALPGLLGFGNPSAVATPTPTARSTVAASLPPTPVPQPTQQIYIVQSGDTMSRIANRFDIPLDELIAANAATIPDPDKLQIGDSVIIPVASVPLPSEIPAASEAPAAT